TTLCFPTSLVSTESRSLGSMRWAGLPSIDAVTEAVVALSTMKETWTPGAGGWSQPAEATARAARKRGTRRRVPVRILRSTPGRRRRVKRRSGARAPLREEAVHEVDPEEMTKWLVGEAAWRSPSGSWAADSRCRIPPERFGAVCFGFCPGRLTG